MSLAAAWAALNSWQCRRSLLIDADGTLSLTYFPRTVGEIRDLLELYPRNRWEYPAAGQGQLATVTDHGMTVCVVIPEGEEW